MKPGETVTVDVICLPGIHVTSLQSRYSAEAVSEEKRSQARTLSLPSSKGISRQSGTCYTCTFLMWASMTVSVYVCVFHVCVCVCVVVCVHVCVCVYVCERDKYVCVCVCEREREFMSV